MTAKELYEIVKDVPREAWPEEIVWDTGLEVWVDTWGATYPPVKRIALLFEASMTRWLMLYGKVTYTEGATVDFEPFYTVEFQGWNVETRGTLVEALAAACKAVGGKE